MNARIRVPHIARAHCVLFAVLLVACALAALSGCVLYDKVAQQKIDDMARQHAGLLDRIKETYAMKDRGEITAGLALRQVRQYTDEALSIEAELQAIKDERHIPGWQIAVMGIANLLIVGFLGERGLTWKNAALGILGAIHSARKIQRKGSKPVDVEGVVVAVAVLGNRTVNAAAEKLPAIKRAA